MALEEQLDLDIADALRGVDRIGNALEQAVAGFRQDLNRVLDQQQPIDIDIDQAAIRRSIDTAVSTVDQIQLDVDEPAITVAINRAIDRADPLNLNVDQSAITLAINNAIGRATNSVTVTADASSITGAINAAIANANNNVTVNGSVNIAGADDAADSTGLIAGNLKTAAVALAGFVGVDAIMRVVSASSDLTEAQTKVVAVFGDSQDAIFDFAKTSAEDLGIAESAALGAAGTFGNLLTSAGVAKEQAAELSVGLVQLAADLSSFNNIDPTVALEKLRAGLSGEVEPLRAIGINFGEAEVKAKALELGLVGVGEELDAQDKLLARYQLILEKSTNAQGDFARTSDGLANQQRILKAQFEDILTVVGAPLVSPLLSILQTIVPAAGSAADAFGRVVGAILPAVDALVTGAGPALDAVFTGIGDTADSLAPALLDIGELLGEILGATTPLIEAALAMTSGVADVTTAVLGFNDGLGLVIVAIPLLAAYLASVLVPAVAAAGGIVGVRVALQGLFVSIAANPVGALIVLLGILAAALAGLNATAGDAASGVDAVAQAAKAVDTQFSGASDGVFEQARAITQLDNDFAKFIETQSTFSTDDQLLALSDLGISLADLRDMLQDGSQGLNDFTAAAIEAGQVDITIDGVEQTAEQVRDLDVAVVNLIASGEAQISGNEDLIASAQNQINALQTVEQQTFLNLIAQGQLTQAQADAILALPAVTSATDTYGAALRAVNTDLDTINANLPATAIPLGQQAETWLALSDAILRGTVTSSDYQLVADNLGVSLEQVAEFGDNVTESVDKFVANAVSKLPQATDALDGFERGTDPQKVIDNLNLQSLSIAIFVDNIEKIREKSPEAADFLLGLGEAAAGPFAQDLVDGKVSIEDFQGALANNKQVIADAEQTIRDSAIDEAAYELGANASEQLGLGLDFSGTTQTQIDAITAGLEYGALSNGGPVTAADQLGKAIGSKLTESMKEELGINSPSKVAIDLGEQVARGLAIGLNRTAPVLSAAEGLAGSALPTSSSIDRSQTSLTIPVTVSGVGVGEAAQVGRDVGSAVAEVLAEVLAL